MLRQKINGKTTTISVNPASADDLTALKGLLAGEVSVFDLKSQGGVAPVSDLNSEALNRKDFIIGKRGIVGSNGRVSCYVRIPHMKKTANLATDVQPLVVGKFNADFITAVKADYITMKFDRG